VAFDGRLLFAKPLQIFGAIHRFRASNPVSNLARETRAAPPSPERSDAFGL
jgi:hypothetical protein